MALRRHLQLQSGLDAVPFGSISTDPVFAARMAERIIRPAFFVYLDWPTGAIRASTLTKQTTALGETWDGVGTFSRIETAAFAQSGALVSFIVGLTSLPQEAVDLDVEAGAIGRRAQVYMGLLDEGFSDPVLHQIFIGSIRSAGDYSFRREEGVRVVDASVEITNGRNPRRAIANHHSHETAEGTDTAWKLLPFAGQQWTWPA